MIKKKYDLAIINRSFWPESEILGEAKLILAEKVAKKERACVITQASVDLVAEAASQSRGKGVKFYVAKSRSNSASGLVKRIYDALIFGPYVFCSLCRAKPKHVYVSTNPPVLVPFMVFIYCSIFRAKYTYHLQDIHPEITNLVVPMNKLVFKLLRELDNITLRHAAQLLTISTDMANFIRKASKTQVPIHLLDNPSFDVPKDIDRIPKTKDIVFCGNAGRVQQIPILLAAIDSYLNNGGTLNFSFVGGGIYASKIQALAEKYDGITYYGYVKASLANKIASEHRWAILPIVDEVTKYAFPSKSSSYLASGCRILAVCGEDTAVARWVKDKQVGISVHASVSSIVHTLREIELGLHNTQTTRKYSVLSPEQFADKVHSLIN